MRLSNRILQYIYNIYCIILTDYQNPLISITKKILNESYLTFRILNFILIFQTVLK